MKTISLHTDGSRTNDLSPIEIDLEAMMQEIRAEVARRTALADPGSHGSGSPGWKAAGASASPAPAVRVLSLARLSEVLPRLEAKERYALSDFLEFHDEAFLRNAYHRILRRGPDANGLDTFLTALRKGRLSKTEIVGYLRFSTEGRERGVHVAGLRVAFALRRAVRVPVLGRFLAIAYQLFRLPEIARDQERLEGAVFHRQHVLNGLLDEMETQIERAFATLEARAHKLEDGQAALDTMLGELRAEQSGIESRIGELQAALSASIHEMGDQIARAQDSIQSRVEAATEQSKRFDGHEYQIKSLETRLTRILGHSVQPSESWDSGQERWLDGFYLGLENRFRGAMDDIRARMSVHLPVVTANLSGSSAPLVDLGCGRGEWLHLLKEHGLAARGVDGNGAMVALCREQGLDAVHSEAIAYLAAQTLGSLGCISAFHLVEHVSFGDLIAFLDESFRALRPDGLLLLETPNPENLVVGACTFHLDPTHRKPLPPALLSFLAETRGFERVEVVRLHPALTPADAEDEPVLPEAIRTLLYGPQDYALMAYKPREVGSTGETERP